LLLDLVEAFIVLILLVFELLKLFLKILVIFLKILVVLLQLFVASFQLGADLVQLLDTINNSSGFFL